MLSDGEALVEGDKCNHVPRACTQSRYTHTTSKEGCRREYTKSMQEAKHHFISIGIVAGIIVIGFVIFLFGYNSILSMSPTPNGYNRSGTAATVVPFTKLVQGSQSTVATRVNYLITTPDQLSALWEFINATNTPPTVDFKKQSVIAVFAGKATSAAISVAKIEDSGARLVSITLMQPESTCPQPAESASPYEIVTVPATLLPLAHKDISKTIGCRD